MTDAEIRASVLTAAAADQTGEAAIHPRGLHDDGKMLRVGSLSFWKHEAFKQLRRSSSPFPAYRRASLTMSLFPDQHFATEPFTTGDGQQATAVVFRSERDPQGTFATFAADATEAQRIATDLNSELDATRTLAAEQHRTNGGDPERFASARAPGLDEMLTQLEPFFGQQTEPLPSSHAPPYGPGVVVVPATR